MPRIHPKPEILDGLLRFFPEERDRFRRYLVRELETRKEVEGRGRVLHWRSSGAEYDQAIDNVLDRFRPRLDAVVRELAEAPALLSALLRSPAERWEELVRKGQGFRNLSLCRLLLERSYQESIETPHQGERLAALALVVADLLDPALYGGRVLEDARARAWIAIGNARRIADNLRGAEDAFRTAEEHLGQGLGDWLDKAQLLNFKACLRRAERRFPEAVRLFRRSISIFLCMGEGRRAAEAVVGLALAEQYRGEPEQAIRLLERAEGLVDPQVDEHLYRCILFNRINCLVDTERAFEAHALLIRSIESFRFPEEVAQLRVRWLEARLAFDLGRHAQGMKIFDEVRKAFARRGDGYLAALASLELAALYARLGQVEEARELAREAQPIFQSLGIVRESLAASIVVRLAS